MVTDVEPAIDDDVEQRATVEMRRLAQLILHETDAVSLAIQARVSEGVPGLQPTGDGAASEALRESTDQNIGAMFATLAFGVNASAIELPPGTLKLLRRAVAGGGDATTVLHGYRVGHERLWQIWSDHVMAHCNDLECLQPVLRQSSAHFFVFIDRMSERLVEEYRREFGATGPADASGASRHELIDLLLGDEPLDVEALRGPLAYDVGGHHLALVLTPVAGDADVGAALEALARAAGQPRVLTRPAGGGTIWAWLGFPGEPAAAVRRALTEVRLPGVVAGLGESGHGREGFRASHEQAAEAERTARLTCEPHAGVTRHEDIELAALLCADRRRAERLVASRLGVLTGPDEASRRLRETLRVYIASGRSKVRTAEQLHVHQKTVTYRLSRAEQLLGHPVADATAELDAALRIHRTLFGS